MWISCPHYIHHILHNYYIIDHNITLNNVEFDRHIYNSIYYNIEIYCYVVHVHITSYIVICSYFCFHFCGGTLNTKFIAFGHEALPSLNALGPAFPCIED